MAVRIYSTDTDSGVVSVTSVQDGGYARVAQIPVGNAPRGAMKYTSDGRGFVCNCGGDTISEIDLMSNRELGRIKVGPAPRGLAIIPGDRFAVVSNSGSNSISIVDLRARQEAAQIAIGRDPRHMAVTKDGTAVFIAIWGSHYVAHVDTSSLVGRNDPASVRESLRIPIGQDRHPYSVALTPDEKELYVANTRSELLSIIDVVRGTVSGEIDLGSRGARAVAFSPKGERAYVSVENTSEIAVIDVVTRAVISRIPVGPGPRGLALEPKTETLYVTAFERSNTGGGGGLSALRSIPVNSLTVVNLPRIRAQVASAAADAASYDFIPVAHGSCSVSVISDELLQAKFL